MLTMAKSGTIVLLYLTYASAWLSTQQRLRYFSTRLDDTSFSRREALQNIILSTTVVFPLTANALVKGNAPPPKRTISETKPKCTNVEECQAQAAKKEDDERGMEIRVPTLITPSGTRYRDLQVGTGEIVNVGDEVAMYFIVLKLGKRSFDGLSGEGTVVFSRGYGFEDDEKKPGDRVFVTTVGSLSNILALNDALAEMQVGGIRRFEVRPQMGWRKPTKLCDGGPGGSGQGGDLKTDVVVVPGATIVMEEACFDMSRQPFPTTCK
jgi:FKBP-type peptidyl-prolyl cis-trans isomerase